MSFSCSLLSKSLTAVTQGKRNSVALVMVDCSGRKTPTYLLTQVFLSLDVRQQLHIKSTILNEIGRGGSQNRMRDWTQY